MAGHRRPEHGQTGKVGDKRVRPVTPAAWRPFLFLAALAVHTACTPAPQSSGPAPIIDMHMHAWTAPLRDATGAPMPPPCDPAPCESAPAAHTSGDAIVKSTIEAMERHNIVHAVISSGEIEAYIALRPARFTPAAAIPRTPGDTELISVDSLRSALLSGEFKAIGEIGTQYLGISPDDDRLDPYFALAEELDVPVLVHTAGLGAHVPTFRSALGRPLLLETVVARHPRLRLYFENAGYPFLDEAIALMTQYPQVHADLSTITWIVPREAFYRYLQGLMAAGLGKRLMFGSDQMAWPEMIQRGIGAIEAAPFLNAAQKRDILYHNAARFLRIERVLDSRGHVP